MPKRRYKSDKEALLNEGKLIVESSGEAKFIHKVDMVNLVLSGVPVATLSAATGNSVNSITGWVKKVDEQGFESLRTKKQSGRPPKISQDQLEEIKAALQEDPESRGFRVWDGPSLSNFVEDKYHVKLGVRQCQRFFHSLGFSLIRPQTYPCPHENSEERNEFKKN